MQGTICKSSLSRIEYREIDFPTGTWISEDSVREGFVDPLETLDSWYSTVSSRRDLLPHDGNRLRKGDLDNDALSLDMALFCLD